MKPTLTVQLIKIQTHQVSIEETQKMLVGKCTNVSVLLCGILTTVMIILRYNSYCT